MTSRVVKEKLVIGRQSFAELGDEKLNYHVPWAAVVMAVLGTKQYTLVSLAEVIDAEQSVVRGLLEDNVDGLNFRMGAKLLSVHCLLFPEEY